MRGPPRLFFAEVLERLGATRAATEWGPVSPATALRWLDRPTFLAGVGTRASGLTDRALGWIAGRAPFFLLVDYGDPLDPLDPPEPWRSRFADGVIFSEAARAKLDLYREWGFERLPVCIAKTQYSLTDDPKRMGAPKGWTLNVSDVRLAAGAGFVIAIAGNMMLMPGLPSNPRALSIDVDSDGNIIGV